MPTPEASKNPQPSLKPTVWVKSIEFNEGTSINCEKTSITVFVGPNNAGKSASLREINDLLQERKSKKKKVIIDVATDSDGSYAEFIPFLEEFAKFSPVEEGQHKYFTGFGFEVHEGDLSHLWDDKAQGLKNLAPLFVKILDTEGRLQATTPAPNINFGTQAFQHPVHFLYDDDDLELTFSNYFKQAFGIDLILNRSAGNTIPIYVGKRPKMDVSEDRISKSYRAKLESLDPLHEQGDGMRSFVGVLLTVFISHYSILLVDEPEAFLHPPQARLLGKMLAKDIPGERQLFLATHSEDFLKGLLDANAQNLQIIRLQRSGTQNSISLLENEDIKKVWKDPILRHSNVLAGLFHSKVIICESDSDCRFYSAVLSAIYDGDKLPSPDVLFIHCGGKHRMPTVIAALTKLNVDLRVISDFDILNDENPLKKVFEGLGGNWQSVYDDWNGVRKAIENIKPEIPAQELREKIDEIFTSVNDKNMPKDKLAEIQKLLKRASAWSLAKELGKSYIPNGQPTQQFERIQTKFTSKGLYIVEVGELEQFVKSIGNHGPAWVNEVLKKSLARDEKLESARKFITDVIN